MMKTLRYGNLTTMKRLFTGLSAFFIFISCTLEKPLSKNGQFDYKQVFLDKINSVRQKGCNCGNLYMPPVAPLTWNDQLMASAYRHAADMNMNRYFSHISLDGRKLKNRVSETGYVLTGYQSYRIGENIAQGQLTISEVMNDWFQSKDHCENLMDPAFKEVGVAMSNYYWVQDFGGRQPFTKAQYLK